MNYFECKLYHQIKIKLYFYFNFIIIFIFKKIVILIDQISCTHNIKEYDILLSR